MEFSRRTDAGRRNQLLVKVVVGLVLVGAAIGVFVGMVSATVLDAVGIKATDPPPPTPSASASAAPSAAASVTPTAAPTTEAPAPRPQPRIEASPTDASPGERVTLSGAFPDLDGGTALQVQRQEGGKWTDFPVNARTKDDGTFSTYILTSRAGEQQFRVSAGETATPPVTITIG
ncbi:hypothetical protein [Solicola sp. PLA-1-18]|uniref:hypothetical protein n=1 Tax=Solicola sp. PLA-1-18 TaxID=3380532 RepID=UPI003B7D5463